MGKNYILTKDTLHRIVYKTIKNMLTESININNDFDVDDIDISKIDIEDLKQGYRDLRLTPTSTLYGDIFSDEIYIKEAIGDILPPDNVANTIITRYNLPSSFVIVKEHYHKIQIYIITAMIGVNDRLIERDMQKMGYFLGHKGKIKNIYGMNYQVLQFEPTCQMQNDETEAIKSKYNTLFHWTPTYFEDNIKRDDLIPNHKNKVFNYPNRTYLMEGDSSMQSMMQLGFLLCVNNADAKNNGNYSLLSIDIKGLDDSIRFYYDPNSEIGIYTESPIPSSKIKVVKRVNFFNNSH